MEGDTTESEAAPVTIRDSLRRSATMYANRGLEAHVLGNRGDFVLFAGIAIELAAKSRLAGENTVFLAPDRNFRASTALHRAAADIRKLPSGTKTIGAMAAVERCATLEPSLKTLLDATAPVVAMRNGEAHLGLASREKTAEELVTFVRSVEALLAVGGEELWETHADLVRAALDEQASSTTRRVAELIAASKARYQQLTSGAEPGTFASLLSMLEARRAEGINNFDQLLVDCPACNQMAVADGATEETGIEVDYDKEGNPEVAWPVLTFYPGTIHCDVCGLELDGDDELEAAGVDLSMENQQVDIYDWMREHYDQEPF